MRHPPSYKNQPKCLREKAVEIANDVFKNTDDEVEAIATSLSRHAFIFNTIRKNCNGMGIGIAIGVALHNVAIGTALGSAQL